MPGMLDTILNVGLCDRTLPALLRMTGNPRHAWDSYRRLVQAYAEVIQGLPAEAFERVLEEHLRSEGVPSVAELDVASLERVTQEFLNLCKAEKGGPFPQDPVAQLEGAVGGVFRSWQSPRAVEYRRRTVWTIWPARPSPSRRWSSATWAAPRGRAWASPETRPPGRTTSTWTSSRMPRGRTSSPAALP